MRKEIPWINWAKMLCIVFIYVNHSEIYLQSFLPHRSLYLPFFVNTFFIISGYLFFKSHVQASPSTVGPSEEMKKRRRLLGNIFFRLMVPSMLFAAINFFPKKLLRGESVLLGDALHDTLLGGSMWFTNALAVAELLLCIPLFLGIRNRWAYLLYSSSLTLLAYIFYLSDTALATSTVPMFYKSGMCATLLLTLGGFYLLFEQRADRLFKGWTAAVLPLALVGYVFCCEHCFDIYSGALDYQPLTVGGLPFILVSTCLVVTLCKWLPAHRWADYWGRHTIGLYFFCGALPNVMAMVLSRLHLPQVCLVPVCALLSLLVALTIVYLLNRFVPWVFDLRLLKKSATMKAPVC